MTVEQCLPDSDVFEREANWYGMVIVEDARRVYEGGRRVDPENYTYNDWGRLGIVQPGGEVLWSVDEPWPLGTRVDIGNGTVAEGEVLIVTSAQGARIDRMVVNGVEVVGSGPRARTRVDDEARLGAFVAVENMSDHAGHVRGQEPHQFHGWGDRCWWTKGENLSNDDLGIRVYSLRWDEVPAEYGVPEGVVLFVVFRVDDEGGVIEALQVFNFGKHEMRLPIGVHVGALVGDNGGGRSEEENLAMVGVKGLSPEQMDVQVLNPTIQRSLSEAEVVQYGKRMGAIAQPGGLDGVSLCLQPLAGWDWELSEVWNWTDDPRHVYMELAMRHNREQVIRNPEGLILPPGIKDEPSMWRAAWRLVAYTNPMVDRSGLVAG